MARCSTKTLLCLLRAAIIAALLVPLRAALVAPADAQAQTLKTREYKAAAIQILENSGTMHYHKNYWITFVSGVVGKELPVVIKLGDTVTVKDRSIRANIIQVTEILETMKWGNQVLGQAGDVHCVVVERPEDIPSDVERNRVWINILKCRVLQ